MKLINGPEVTPSNGEKPEYVVILSHGYGADGSNLIDLAKFFTNDFKNIQFLCPNAPENFEMGGAGYQWFSLMDRSENVMLELANKASAFLNKYIDSVMERFSLPINKIFLLGFSQGTMVSLNAALKRKDKCAGVIGFSGMLIDKNNFESRPDVILLHGDHDDVVPYNSMQIAESILHKNKIKVEHFTMRNTGHYISYEGLDKAAEFIKERI